MTDPKPSPAAAAGPTVSFICYLRRWHQPASPRFTLTPASASA
jgi:hypothetical protein